MVKKAELLAVEVKDVSISNRDMDLTFEMFIKPSAGKRRSEKP